ncbi:MAG: FtsX-like permease family protein [Acidimicrobiia bacterium]|nr:FtsX-like permease family protein [Acidimicrobiia bacterium]
MSLANALVSSVRRRKHDLAILKALGFTRRQVSAAVAWQATALVVVALAVGLPLGAIGGVWLWSVFADQLGIATDSLVPVAALALAIPLGIVAGNAAASVPSWAAGRIKPSETLRTE